MCSVAERIVVTVDVGAAAFTIALVAESVDCVEGRSTGVTRENAVRFVVQLLGHLLEEMGEELQEPCYECSRRSHWHESAMRRFMLTVQRGTTHVDERCEKKGCVYIYIMSKNSLYIRRLA